MSDIIREPGKFEGQPCWTPTLWHLSLEGWSDEDFGRVQLFHVDAALRLKVPALPADVVGIQLEESEQGFVTAEVFTTEDEYTAAVERASDGDTYDGDWQDDPDDIGVEL